MINKAEGAHLIRPLWEWKEGKRILWDIYVVREQYRGMGIMPVATEMLVECLREYGFRTLEAHIHEDNIASQLHTLF